MRILAIDAGLKTGWACWNDPHTETGLEEFKKRRGESQGIVFLKFNGWLDRILGVIKPGLVVYEQAHHRHGATTNLHIGMTTRIEEKCEALKIDYAKVHSSDIKKQATGRGNAKKEEVLEAARERFGHIEDDNVADARFMLEWAKEEFGTD